MKLLQNRHQRSHSHDGSATSFYKSDSHDNVSVSFLISSLVFAVPLSLCLLVCMCVACLLFCMLSTEPACVCVCQYVCVIALISLNPCCLVRATSHYRIFTQHVQTISTYSVFCVAVRPYHPTPPTTALAEGAGASRVQACRPCLQVSAADSAIVPLRRTMPAGRL